MRVTRANLAAIFSFGLWLPKLQDVLFITLFISVIGFGPRLLNVDGDLGRHLTIGEYILTSHSIPTRDIFSHTMTGEPVTPHEWLAQLSFALAYRLGDLDGVVLLCALLIAITFTLSFRQSYARSGMIIISSGWAIMAAAAASLHWLARPHLFTLLLVVLWTGALERLRRREKIYWWIFPLLMFLWVNFHGAFIAGFVIWGMYLLGEVADSVKKMGEPCAWDWRRFFQYLSKTKTFLTAGATTVLASLVNPSGWGLWENSLGYLRNRYLVGHTAEYLPPDFHTASTWPFLIMITLSFLLIGFGRPRLPAASIFLLAGWAAMALYSVRNVPLFALVSAPVLAEITAHNIESFSLLARFSRFEERLNLVERSLKGYVWAFGLTILVAGLLLSGTNLDFYRRGNRFDPEVFPVQAVDWIATHPQTGNVFNHFPWGGYLLFRLWPGQTVFIDGQTDFYGEALTRQYEHVITLQDGWQDVLQQYQASWVLEPAGSPLVLHLEQDPEWQMVYQDPVAAVLRKTSGQ